MIDFRMPKKEGVAKTYGAHCIRKKAKILFGLYWWGGSPRPPPTLPFGGGVQTVVRGTSHLDICDGPVIKPCPRPTSTCVTSIKPWGDVNEGKIH
jgi:hypothetical protein